MQMLRSHAFVAASLALVMGLVPAAAQTPDQQQPATPEEPRLPGEPALPDAPPMPPTPDEMPAIEEALSGLEIPSEELGREAQLEALFRQLGDAENPHWPIIQGQIWRVWRRSGSASMDLLLHRAQEAIEKKDYATAFVHLDDLVRLAPEFAEGWNQRATAYFLTEDYGRSMRDIEAVLALEPRHFGALSGLGIILDRTGNDAGALRAFRRALELHPNLPGAQKGVDKLSEQVDGQEH